METLEGHKKTKCKLKFLFEQKKKEETWSFTDLVGKLRGSLGGKGGLFGSICAENSNKTKSNLEQS